MTSFRSFAGTKSFWREYESLTLDKKAAADSVFEQFRKDPFAAGLGTHKIARLSALRKEAVWSVPVLGDLRACFVIRGDMILSILIGTHDIYK